MNFKEFLQFVPKFVDSKLPALEAHIKMGPLERLQHLQNEEYRDMNPKMAAVLMLLYPKNNVPHLVLIVRNVYPGIHSAQIAFPGGKYEPEDKDFAFTALRETQEEIGVPAHKIQIIKPFTQLYITPSNFMVHPFLGICNDELIFNPNPSEVSALIEVPLSLLLNDAIVVNTTVTTSYLGTINIMAFKIDDRIVWGATAMILSELKEVLKQVVRPGG